MEALSPPLALYCDEIQVGPSRSSPEVVRMRLRCCACAANTQAIKAHLAEAIAAVEHKLEQQRALSAEREQVHRARDLLSRLVTPLTQRAPLH